MLAVMTLVLAALYGRPEPAGADPHAVAGYRVIVNVANAVDAVDRHFLSDAFLKKTTRWGNDVLIRPVDLASDSASRRAFSEDVMKKSVGAVKSYWQQMVFSGRNVPPPELEADAEVVRFVVHNPGGLGYVSPSADVTGVKPIAVR